MKNGRLCTNCGQMNAFDSEMSFCGNCGGPFSEITTEVTNNLSLLFGRPYFYWIIMLPLGLLNLSIAWFGAQLIIDFIKYPGGDVFGIPNFIFFVIGILMLGIATPGLQALYKFHKVEKHNSMNDARRVIIIEYTIIGVLSIATVVIPIIAVAMIFYIKSSRWDIYVEFMRFSKIKTKSVNKLDPDDTHIIQTGIV